MKVEVLLNRATNILRELFLTRWRFTHDGKEWVKGEKTGHKFITRFIRSCGHVSYQMKQCLRSGDVTQWDLTTLARVLRTATFSRLDNVNLNFEKRIKKENDKIKRLIRTRNRVVHHPTKIILDKDFHGIWNELSQMLVDLGDSVTKLDRLKMCILDTLLHTDSFKK